MIEEDLSKQLGSSPRDREWDAEPSLEPYITGLENGGSIMKQHKSALKLPEMFDNRHHLACCFFIRRKIKIGMKLKNKIYS